MMSRGARSSFAQAACGLMLDTEVSSRPQTSGKLDFERSKGYRN